MPNLIVCSDSMVAPASSFTGPNLREKKIFKYPSKRQNDHFALQIINPFNVMGGCSFVQEQTSAGVNGNNSLK